MDNMIDLEQLDYRDQLIKQYIDEHSGGGGGSSDYIPITIAVTRFMDEGGGDTQTMYVGVPIGTDLTELKLTYVRHHSVRVDDPNAQSGDWNYTKYNGWHQVWAIPQKEKIPLFNFDFKDRTTPNFTKVGMDFYEIQSIWGDDEYDMYEFINDGLASGYEGKNDGQRYTVYVTTILSHKNGGLCLMNKDDKIVSNVASFRVEYSDSFGEYRLTTSRF